MLGKQVGKSSGVEGFPATDHTEIEWQFDADELEPVEDWLGRHPSSTTDLIVAPESTVEITDAYYDTDDWRLYRAGYALRVRETYGEVEATMKSLTPAEGSLRERREISEPLRDDKPATLNKAAGPVGERSRAIASGRELRQLFRVRTRRQRFTLLLEGSTDENHDDARVGEVSLDASEIPLGGEQVASEYLPELGTTTGGTRVPRDVAFTMGVCSERCSREARDLRSIIPDSKPFRALKKGKRWKMLERVLKDRNSADAPGKRVR